MDALFNVIVIFLTLHLHQASPEEKIEFLKVNIATAIIEKKNLLAQMDQQQVWLFSLLFLFSNYLHHIA